MDHTQSHVGTMSQYPGAAEEEVKEGVVTKLKADASAELKTEFADTARADKAEAKDTKAGTSKADAPKADAPKADAPKADAKPEPAKPDDKPSAGPSAAGHR